MNTKGRYKVMLVFLFTLVLHVSTYSQIHKYFIISGKIISETELAESSSVRIIKNNKLTESQIPEHGRFRLELDYNAEYQLIFSKKGSRTKTIIVNTAIPQNLMIRPENFPHFLMAVKLNDVNPVASNPYFEEHTNQISYSEQKGSFLRVGSLYDSEYAETVKPDQNQALRSQNNKSKMQTYQVF